MKHISVKLDPYEKEKDFILTDSYDEHFFGEPEVALALPMDRKYDGDIRVMYKPSKRRKETYHELLLTDEDLVMLLRFLNSKLRKRVGQE